MNDDLISREYAIKTLLDEGLITAAVYIERMPSADLSEYSDKLWKTAYERGKAEAIIRCDECEHWDLEWIPAVGEGHYCPMMDHVMVGDEWCCYGVRRMSDG